MRTSPHNNWDVTSRMTHKMDQHPFMVIYVGLGISFIATLFDAFLVLRYGSWQFTLLLGASLILALVTLLSVSIMHRGKQSGFWISIYAGQVTLALAGILTYKFGLLSTVSLLVLTYLVVSQTRTGFQSRLAILFSVILGFCTVITEWLRPDIQVVPPIELKIFMPGMIALAALSYALLFMRRFRSLNLRSQLITIVISVSAVCIAGVAIFSNFYYERLLTYNANTRLFNSALQTARSLDELLLTRLADVKAHAQIPELIDYLRQDSGQQIDSSQYAKVTRTLSALIQQEPSFFVSYALLDKQGVNVADTQSSQFGEDESAGDYFNHVVETGGAYISPVQYSVQLSKPIIYFSSPVVDTNGEMLGVLRARYLSRPLDDVIHKSAGNAGHDSYAILVDEYGVLLSHGKRTDVILKSITPMKSDVIARLISEKRLPNWPEDQLTTNLPGLINALDRPSSSPFFSTELGDGSNTAHGVIKEMSSMPWKVIFITDQATFLGPIESQTRSLALLGLVIVGLSTIAGFLIANMLTAPIRRLTEAARQVADGNYAVNVPVEGENEFGLLANAFNAMTSQLQFLLEGLEQRVADRTEELERSASELRATAEVGGTIATIRELDELLPRVTQLISERYGYYHVGIFLLEPSGEYAILRAANSEGGQRMLKREHRIRVGEDGIVGFVTGNKEPRIAIDVGIDAVVFNNPDLPGTRSEMALPLIIGDRVLGALDVQSSEPNTFSIVDVSPLQLLADQVAIAIDNARLFSENNAALETIERAYGELTREAWAKLIHSQPNLGILANRFDVVYPPSGRWTSEMLEAAQTGEVTKVSEDIITVPIKEREQVLGVLNLRKPNNNPWSSEEISLAETLAQQLALALENARLYSETQKRAERERLAGKIVAKMRSSNDPNQILQTVVQELRHVLRTEPEEPTSLDIGLAETRPLNSDPRTE